MRCRTLCILLLATLASCSETGGPAWWARGNCLVSFELQDAYRAWQGVAVDRQHVYVLTDRNESFGLENIISVYSHKGKKLRELRQAYQGKDSKGQFMSFGDGNVLDGRLYVTAYNFNSGSRPLESRVLIYSAADLSLLAEHDIVGGVAESVTKHWDTYWVTYHDEMTVRRFDPSFRLLGTYALSETMGEYGGYQGSFWDGDDLLVQMHGPNEPNLNPARGMDRYHFEEDGFVFAGSEEPLSYGAGQGVAQFNGFLVQNDRPGNSIVVRPLR